MKGLLEIIIKPSGKGIAPIHQCLADIRRIRCLVVSHEDMGCRLSDHFDLTGCMGHDKTGAFRQTGAPLPCLLDDIVRPLDRGLEESVAEGWPALEYVIGRDSGKR